MMPFAIFTIGWYTMTLCLGPWAKEVRGWMVLAWLGAAAIAGLIWYIRTRGTGGDGDAAM